MIRKANIKIISELGFHYDVIIEHHITLGVSNAMYEDVIIARREYGKSQPPLGDDDREWEMFEGRISEWHDEIATDLTPTCKLYFDQKEK